MTKNDNAFNADTARKIQVWANDKESHFAIRLDIDGHFRAKTDDGMGDENFVKMVDQSDFLGDLKYDWAFTLNHWIQARIVKKDER